MLTHDTNGEVRISEQLTNTDAYLYCYPYRLSMMWQEIANELQRFGGNTLANLYRRNGVCYKEILRDVCRKAEVYFNDKTNTKELERSLLEKVCHDTVGQMDEKELRNMAEELNIPVKNPRKYMIIAALQLAIKRGGALSKRIILYVARMISKMLLGHGLAAFGSNIQIGRAHV